MTASRAAVVIFVSLSLCGRGAALAQEKAASPGPNILVIQADDLGYGDLGVYGQARFGTPALDRLAREGIRFTQYYAGSAICAPSRAALMTGRHTGHTWIRGHGDVPLRQQDTTIAEVLRMAGYRTAMIGKWGLGRPGTTGAPERQGFEYSFGFLDHNHAHRQYTDHLWRNGERIPTDPEHDYVNDLFTREAASFIERDDPRPFFLYLNYTVPHAELRAPEDAMRPYLGRYPENPFTNPKADAAASGPDETSLGFRSQQAPRAAYAAMITRMDRDIGRLVDLIDRGGAGARTLLLFVSDNGPHRAGGGDPAFFNSADGLRGGKGTLYEGGIRVPMIARWSGLIPPGQVSATVWAHWDLLPTLADLAHAQAPGNLDGVSMVGALRGEPGSGERFLYWELPGRGFHQAVRDGDWKALRTGLRGDLELYNLARDPGEQHDVAAEHPEVVARMEQLLQTARTESPLWPVPPPWRAWVTRPRLTVLLLALAGLFGAALVGRRVLRERAARG